MIRKGPWKLIEAFDPEGVELYNLADDLNETCNLTNAKPELVREMRRELDDWRRDVGAETMRPNSAEQPPTTSQPKSKRKSSR